MNMEIHHIEVIENDLGVAGRRYYANGDRIEWMEYTKFATHPSRLQGSDWVSRKIGYTERGFLVRRFESMKGTP